MKAFKVSKVNGSSHELNLDLRQFIYDENVIKQNIESRCKIIRGELDYKTSLGVLIGSNKDATDLSIINTIMTTEGVKGITKFSSKIESRKYTASITVQTQYNEIEVII